MNVNKVVHLFLQDMNNLAGKSIAVGYSAGADSTALLHIMAQKAKHFNFNLEAVFFSHTGSPINDGEDKNLELAKKTCKELNIKLIDVDLEMNKSAKKSWEQLGREGRLSFYKQQNYDYVFLGHHQDDQNETTMIQIMRGGGRGSAAMKEIDGIFCRPMLKVPKKEIYKFLEYKKLDWIEDPTNTNIEFTRNWWRNEGLPTIEKYYPNYGQLLENFRQKNNALNNIAFDMAKVDGLENFLTGKPIDTKELPDYRIQNLLSHAFSFIGNSIENNKVDNMIKIGKATNEAVIEVGNCLVHFDGEKLLLSKLENKLSKKNKP